MQDPLRNFKAEFFKALSHPARIKILEILRTDELSVTELQDHLGIEASSVSQHLSVLRHKNIVESRKAGTTVYYRVRDPEILELLDVARRIFTNHLINNRSTLEQLEEENDQVNNAKRAALVGEMDNA
ncbi:MAG: metalloregulator ArsR/SmtB family transcription factor [Chloroflexi bacterium]|nr:metalloregulator ArsR/SmtB family transcription factor [Chloroflexota bacterium]